MAKLSSESLWEAAQGCLTSQLYHHDGEGLSTEIEGARVEERGEERLTTAVALANAAVHLRIKEMEFGIHESPVASRIQQEFDARAALVTTTGDGNHGQYN